MDPKYGAPVAIEDKLLLFYILAKSPGNQLNRIENQKLAFFVKAAGYQNQEILFQSRFRRDKRGPVAPHIYDFRQELVNNQLGVFLLGQILNNEDDKREEILELDMNYSYVILEVLESIVNEYSWVFDKTDEVLKKYMGIPWQQRQAEVYNIIINGKKVQDFKIGDDIVMPYDNSYDIFRINQKKKEQLKNLFDKDTITRLIQDDENFCYLMTYSNLKD